MGSQDAMPVQVLPALRDAEVRLNASEAILMVAPRK